MSRDHRVLRTAYRLFPCCISTIAVAIMFVSKPASAARNYAGICLSPAYDYVPNKLFADAIKMGRGFAPLTGGGKLVPPDIDTDGWPLIDASILVWQDPVHMQGTYRLYFTTQNPSVDASTVSVTVWPAGAITNQHYDATTNTVTGDIVVSDTGGSILKLSFTNTYGGVKNVKLMRPRTVGGATPCDTTVTFTPDFLRAMSKFQGARFWALVDGGSKNMVANWSDRTLPTYSCQQNRTIGGGSAGVAWEYIIRLCNEAHIDLWVNVQFLATDDYVQHLATLLKNTLDTQQAIYVEYANELWNWAGDYDSFRNKDSAAAEVARGGSPLNYDGESGATANWRRIAKRGKEVSDIFRSVFGDAAMMSRVRPVLMTQLGNGQTTLGTCLKFMHDYYNNAAHVSSPHPANYYFYGAGGAPYYRPTGTYDINTVWNSGSMNIDTFTTQQLKTEIAMCAAFGLKRVAYEGGAICFDKTAVWASANDDPRMTSSMIAHHTAWSNFGGGEFYYSDLTGWSYNDPSGNFMHYIEQQNTTRMQALDSINASSRAAVTVGRPVPDTFPGDPADYKEYTGADGYHEIWRSYMIRVDRPGTYGVTVTASNVRSGGVAVYIDGVQIGSFTPSGTGSQTSPKYPVVLQAGLHGILVPFSTTVNNVFTIGQVAVTFDGASDARSTGAHLSRRSAPVISTSGNRLRVSLNVREQAGARYIVCRPDGRIVGQGIVTSLPGTGRAGFLTNRLGSGMYLVRCGALASPVVINGK